MRCHSQWFYLNGPVVSTSRDLFLDFLLLQLVWHEWVYNFWSTWVDELWWSQTLSVLKDFGSLEIRSDSIWRILGFPRTVCGLSRSLPPESQRTLGSGLSCWTTQSRKWSKKVWRLAMTNKNAQKNCSANLRKASTLHQKTLNLSLTSPFGSWWLHGASLNRLEYLHLVYLPSGFLNALRNRTNQELTHRGTWTQKTRDKSFLLPQKTSK